MKIHPWLSRRSHAWAGAASLTACLAPALLLHTLPLHAQAQAAASAPASLQIDLGQPGHKMPPLFYGLMTEEINHSYDGGLYAELIQNRTFQDNHDAASHWSLTQQAGAGAGASATMTLDRDTEPLSAALPVSLRLDIAGASASAPVGIANDGYWGVPIRAGTVYHASFYAKAAPGFSGPLTLALQSADGGQTFAAKTVPSISAGWHEYTVIMTTQSGSPASPELGRFAVLAGGKGTVWINLVSLFPPTYKNQLDGFRPDLMEKLAAMRPAFLRLPGGNYVEGGSIADRYDWKKTIGPLTDRPGHPSPWSYRSSDGLGLLEYMRWCEQLGMEPVLAVYAGYSLNGEHVDAGPNLQPYVQDTLDEIEYVSGDTTTKWGAERARDGHPKPFPLHYVEVGNEDFFDKSGSYPGRFAQFYNSIKAKYPGLQVIATAGGQDWGGKQVTLTVRPDVVDEHYYQPAAQMLHDATRFDSYDRNGPKVFVGEWAAFDKIAPWEAHGNEIGPTATYTGALGDAAWLTGLERNSDIVIMESYAPLFVDVNPGASQWRINLIGFNALSSFGSPSYYVQTMFGQHHGDTVAPTTLTGQNLAESVTRDSKAGAVYIHLVNSAGEAQPVHITMSGAQAVGATAKAYVMTGDPAGVNTMADPVKYAPSAAQISGVGADFTYTAAPYSVTVLEVQAR